MNTTAALHLILCAGVVLIIIKEIYYYRIGWGMNFHLIDDDQDSWVKPFPTKLERLWLLLAILAKVILVVVLLLPLFFS